MTILLHVLQLFTSILTGGYDNTRLNAATETVLTTANVTVGKFGPIGKLTLSHASDLYGQPLIAESVTISAVVHNVAVICSMQNYCQAFDAVTMVSLWTSTQLGTPYNGYPLESQGLFYLGPQGCIATPVIDPGKQFVYAVCVNSTPNWILYKLDITTGSTVSSVILTGSVTGTGDPTGGDLVSGGVLTFYPAFLVCRSALVYANSSIYIACSSQNDVHPWHGWVVSVNATSMALTGIWCATPNGYGGGIWQAGAGPSVDGSGNLYVINGNGDYDGVTNFGQSAVKLSPTLSVLDWWTPSNFATLNTNDWDLSSGHPMLLTSPGLLVFGAKDFNIYSVPTGCMGHLQGGGTVCPTFTQTLNTVTPGGFGNGVFSSVFMNSIGYFGLTNGNKVYSFALSGSTFSTSPTLTTASFASPGAQTTGSSNSGSNAILWATTVSSSAYTTKQPGVLRAFNAGTLVELWNSGTTLGTFAKWAAWPTVWNGRVFVPTNDGSVAVFGLLTPSGVRGKAALRGKGSIH